MARLIDFDLEIMEARLLELMPKDGSLKLLKYIEAAGIASNRRLKQLLEKLQKDGKIVKGSEVFKGRALIGYRLNIQPSIQKLEGECEHLKEIQKIVSENILWDITEYLFPESPSEQAPIWSIANLHQVLPKYSVEQINDVLASNQHDFQYIKDKGWQLMDIFEGFD